MPERPSSPPGDGLDESWFDRPGRKLRLPPLPQPAPDPDPDDGLDDPWFVGPPAR